MSAVGGNFYIWCGSGGMLTTRWARYLLLVGILQHKTAAQLQTENIRQLIVACSQRTCAVFCGCCDVLD
jgi:hypothetical protein